MLWWTILACASPQAPTVERAEPAAPPSAWDLELASVDAEIEATQARVAASPTDWTVLEHLSGLYTHRARLSGSFDDWASAESALEQAFAVATPGAGPFLSQAGLDYSLHRFERVQPMLDRAEQKILLDDNERAAIEQVRANLSLQLGDYGDGAFLHVLELHPSVDAWASLANQRYQVGDEAGALAALDTGDSLYHGTSGMPPAWFALQRGLLDLRRGRHADALAHYREAERHLAGWWLLDEHIAEIALLQGDLDEAEALYHDVIDRTGSPEFMDAMAQVHLARGDVGEAAQWIARAEQAWEPVLERYPEAAWGHALGHWLDFERDPARAVAMAEANRALRPNAESDTWLAQAYLQDGRIDDARVAIERALATPWYSADLHLVAAAVYEARGEQALADEQRRLARAIDPTTSP